MILMTSNIVESFNEMTSMKRNSKKPGNKDWKELYAILQQSQPQVYERISSCKLSSQELQVCVLTYLGMDNTKISIQLQKLSAMQSRKQTVSCLIVILLLHYMKICSAYNP